MVLRQNTVQEEILGLSFSSLRDRLRGHPPEFGPAKIEKPLTSIWRDIRIKTDMFILPEIREYVIKTARADLINFHDS